LSIRIVFGPRLSEAARVLNAVGERLRAGDRVITSLVVQAPLVPGDQVAADMGALGRAGLSIGPSRVERPGTSARPPETAP
jgi:hypothetical protein